LLLHGSVARSWAAIFHAEDEARFIDVGVPPPHESRARSLPTPGSLFATSHTVPERRDCCSAPSGQLGATATDGPRRNTQTAIPGTRRWNRRTGPSPEN